MSPCNSCGIGDSCMQYVLCSVFALSCCSCLLWVVCLNLMSLKDTKVRERLNPKRLPSFSFVSFVVKSRRTSPLDSWRIPIVNALRLSCRMHYHLILRVEIEIT